MTDTNILEHVTIPVDFAKETTTENQDAFRSIFLYDYISKDNHIWIPEFQLGITNLKLTGCFDYIDLVGVLINNKVMTRTNPSIQQHFSEKIKKGYVFDDISDIILPCNNICNIYVCIRVNDRHNIGNKYTIEFDVIRHCDKCEIRYYDCTYTDWFEMNDKHSNDSNDLFYYVKDDIYNVVVVSTKKHEDSCRPTIEGNYSQYTFDFDKEIIIDKTYYLYYVKYVYPIIRYKHSLKINGQDILHVFAMRKVTYVTDGIKFSRLT